MMRIGYGPLGGKHQMAWNLRAMILGIRIGVVPMRLISVGVKVTGGNNEDT